MGMRELLQPPTHRLAGEPDTLPFHRVATDLLNQQCWCWGRDITRPEGNLMLCYGFQRLRPPKGTGGGNRYRYLLDSGHELSLWGFGAMIADGPHAVHLGRFDFEPQLCAAVNETRTCWTPTSMPELRRPTTARELTRAGTLCAELLAFVGEYESWIAEVAGLAYRQQTIDAFRDATHTAAEAKELWPRLAKRVARHYERRAATSCMASTVERCA